MPGTPAFTPPTVSKTFSPSEVPAGVTSRLTITIANPAPSPSHLTATFTDTLPAGVVIAALPGASTTCGGVVSATPGGSSVSLPSGSTVPPGSCTIAVSVTAAAAGSYVNTIPVGALQTNHDDNRDPATSTLTVTSTLPVCPVITVAPTTMTHGFVGHTYSQTIIASGGTAPYTFIVTAGALPPGVVFAMIGGIGLLSGTPTTNGGHAFTIRVTDAEHCPADLAYTMNTTTAVPTMPELMVLVMAAVLASVGYIHLRQRA